MCKVYDFQKARSHVEKHAARTSKEAGLIKRIADLSLEGAAELALWELEGDDSKLHRAAKIYEEMQRKMGLLRELRGKK